MLVGTLDTFGVAEVLQFGADVFATASVRLWDGENRSGALALCSGKVFSAHFGHLTGAEAALALMALADGRFEVSLNEPKCSEERTAIGQLTPLLLEAARLADELERHSSALPPRKRILQSRGIPKSDPLECGLVAVATALQTPQSLPTLEATLPMCPTKVRLAVSLLAEDGYLGRESAMLQRPTPTHLMRWLSNAIDGNRGAGRVLVVYPPGFLVASVNAALARVVQEAQAAPLAAFQNLPEAGPTFARVRPATGGVLSLTFLAASEKNAVFLETLARSCDGIVLVGESPKMWPVPRQIPLVRTVETADTWLIRALIECFAVPIPSPSETLLK